MEQKLIVTCLFSDFLKAYSGEKMDIEQQFNIVQDALLSDDNEEITRDELKRFYNEWVEIRFIVYEYTGDGTVNDELRLRFTLQTGEELDYSCCVDDIKRFAHDLMTVVFNK